MTDLKAMATTARYPLVYAVGTPLYHMQTAQSSRVTVPNANCATTLCLSSVVEKQKEEFAIRNEDHCFAVYWGATGRPKLLQ